METTDKTLADLRLELTDKQASFVDYYVQSMNATKAYKLAYKCSDTTANANGWKTLKKTKVKAYLNYLLEEMKVNNIATAEEVLLVLSEIIRDPKARNADRLKATEQLGKFHQLYKDSANTQGTEITVVIGGDDTGEE